MNQRACAAAVLCWAGAIGLVAIGCGGAAEGGSEDVVQSESAIIDGTPVVADTRGACHMTWDRAQCSSTLVTNRWVLTGKHCVDGSETFIEFDCPAARRSVVVTDIAGSVFAHPSNDAMLVRLPTPMNIFGGTRTVHNALFTGDDLTKLVNKSVYCSGFGMTSETEESTRELTSAQMTIAEVNETRVSMNRNALGQLPFFGDSGSTCFLDENGHQHMVGIATGLTPVLPGQPYTTINYLRPGLFRDWVDQTLFTPPVSIGTGATSGPALTTLGAKGMLAFVRHSGNAIYWSRYDGAWSGRWTSIGGGATSDPAAVSYAAGRALVFIRGPSHEILYSDFNGSSFSAWSSLGGDAISDPAVVLTSPGRIMVLFVAPNHTLRYKTRDAAGVWSAWGTKNGSVLGELADEITAVRVADESVIVLARTTSGSIIYTSYTNGNWNINWFGLSGGPFKWGPAATSSAPSRMDVFAVNQDGSIAYRKWWGFWADGWTNLGGTATYPVEATSRGTGSMDIAYRGANGASVEYREYAP